MRMLIDLKWEIHNFAQFFFIDLKNKSLLAMMIFSINTEEICHVVQFIIVLFNILFNISGTTIIPF